MKRITDDQIVERIKSENPWWREPHRISPSHSKWTPRPYLDLFYPLLRKRNVRRAVVLMGPRRVGKTVMLHHAIGRLLEVMDPLRICYFSVDHPAYNGLSLEHLLGLYGQATGVDYRKEESVIFFDEIQYLRNWEIHLKTVVDDYNSLKCVASGSAAAALRLRSIESGAGRFTDFLLPPLTFYEYLELLNKTHSVKFTEENGEVTVGSSHIDMLNENFIHYLNYGGYPEVLFSEDIQEDPGRYIKSDIIDKVLLRDLPILYGINDIQELNYLLTTLAFNTANEISLQELSQNAGIAKNTIKKYIEYLQTAFLIRVIHRVDRNARRFKRANFFKVYITNPSMRSALFSPVGADDPAVSALVETGIFAQSFHADTKFLYARWKRGEVDMIHLAGNQKADQAVEIKWSDRYCARPDELKSLLSFCHRHDLSEGVVTTRTITAELTRKGVKLRYVPASLYCYGFGYSIIHGKQVRIV